MKVKIYWNFNRKCWSVQDASTNLVVDHAKRLVLASPTFKVSQAGRQRVIREGRKNVHAKVAGYRKARLDRECLTRVRYNPYRDESFVTEAGDRVDAAEMALFMPDGRVYVS